MRKSLIATATIALAGMFPAGQRRLWRWWYDQLASRDAHEMLLMNYGYWDTTPIDLPPELEPYRYPLQLYRHLLKNVPVTDKIILEAGCGRGGGLLHLHQTLKPRCSIGIDLSAIAAARAQREIAVPALAYLCADVEAIPIKSRSIDIVINVESRHCYPRLDVFLGEVSRILKPGGQLLLCDFVDSRFEKRLQQAIEKKLSVTRHETISRNVLNALDAVREQRLAFINSKIPRLFRLVFKHFAAVPGSNLYQQMQSGDVVYRLYQANKPR